MTWGMRQKKQNIWCRKWQMQWSGEYVEKRDGCNGRSWEYDGNGGNSGYSREYGARFIVKEELDVVTCSSDVCWVNGGRVINGSSGISREYDERSGGCSE